MIKNVFKALLLTLFIIFTLLLGLKTIIPGIITVSGLSLLIITIVALVTYYGIKYIDTIISSFKFPLILFFVTVIFLSFFFIVLGFGRDTSSKENRKLERFPPIPVDFVTLKSFSSKFEKALNDSFPFRNNILRVYAKANSVRILNSNQDVLVGSNGFLYLTHNSSIDDYLGKVQLTESQMLLFKNKMIGIENECKKRNIKFLYVMCPDKHTVYPEYMPPGYIQGKTHRADQLFASMDGINIDMLDLRPVLLKEKNEIPFLLYYKNDSHWNLFGGFVSFNAIQKRLGEEQILFENFHYTEQKDAFELDLANVLLNRSDIREKEYIFNFFQNKGINYYSPQIFMVTGVGGYSTNPLGNRKRILFFHDSFIGGMTSFFSTTYSDVKYVWSYQADVSIIDEFKPDYVVLENVERRFNYVISDIK